MPLSENLVRKDKLSVILVNYQIFLQVLNWVFKGNSVFSIGEEEEAKKDEVQTNDAPQSDDLPSAPKDEEETNDALDEENHEEENDEETNDQNDEETNDQQEEDAPEEEDEEAQDEESDEKNEDEENDLQQSQGMHK